MAGSHTFSSLRKPLFRQYFGAQLVSLAGTWAQVIALSWLVLEMTGSGTALGLIHAAHFLPLLLLGPWGGLVVDRRIKHKLLMVTQSISAMLSLLLGVLVVTGEIQLWQVFAITLCLGTVRVFDSPARFTIIYEMAGRKNLQNALAWNATSVSLTRMVGPAIAGLLIATVGIGVCFIVNAFSYLPILTVLARIKPDDLDATPLVERAKGQLRDGLRYAWRTPVLRNGLIMMALIGTLTYEWPVVLPLLARFSLDGTAADYAALVTSMGIGASIGGIVASRRRSVTPAMISLAALLVGMAVFLVALAPTLTWALLAMALVGFFAIGFDSLSNSLIQLNSTPEMRGRVIALWGVAYLGSSPIGGPILGWISQYAGPRAGLAVGGLAAVAASGFGYASSRSQSKNQA